MGFLSLRGGVSRGKSLQSRLTFCLQSSQVELHECSLNVGVSNRGY